MLYCVMNFMKLLVLLSLVVTSLFSLDFNSCKHLLNRTSLGITHEELASCQKEKSYENAVKTLVYKKNIYPPYVKSLSQLVKKPSKKLNTQQRKEFRQALRKQQNELKIWWFKNLLTTKDPFLEKMVLFWSNHFTSSLKKVRQPSLIYQQNILFRKYALGSYAQLLHAIVEDPAMLIYLDNRANKKIHPNENLARELLELFTMGEGNYSEKDIKELARSLSGYSVDKQLKFRFKKNIHDNDVKILFGKSGNFNVHDMIDIILQQDATSEFIVKKLWLEFVSYELNEQEIKRLAKLFKNNNYEMKPLMVEMLNSSYFKLDKGQMIKSPIELIAGTLRSFKSVNFDMKIALRYLNRLGQNPLNPPNVKGWVGGERWIDANTLLVRREFLNKFVRGDDMIDITFESENLAKELIPLDVLITPANTNIKTLRLILQHPLYQLK